MLKNKIKSDRFFLAGIAFILAALALAIASPNGLNNVNRPPNFIGVIELAEKIKNRERFQLIDLRDSIEYTEFHIPTAQNVPLNKINQNIKSATVFYSGDDLLARRLWDSLDDSAKSNTRILYGGIRDWYSRLLYPTLPFGEQVHDSKLLDQIHDLCQFYGGFADFEADSTLLNYYQKDLSTNKWPNTSREGTLVRKGC